MDTGDGLKKHRISRGTQSLFQNDLLQLQLVSKSASSTILSIPFFKTNFLKAVSILPSDVLLCAFILASVTFYSLLCFFQEPFDNRSLHVNQGWEILRLMQDRSDEEWNLWTTVQRKNLIIAYASHISFSLFLTYLLKTWQVFQKDAAIQKKDNLQFLFGIIILCIVCDFTVVATVALLSLIFYAISRVRSVAVTVFLGTVAFYYLRQTSSPQTVDWEFSELIVNAMPRTMIKYAILRCCSFGFETALNPSLEISLSNILRYNFYVPFFFFGPLFTYNSFINKKEDLSTSNTLPFLRHLTRTVIYIVGLDFLLHFFHVIAIAGNDDFLAGWEVTSVVLGLVAFLNVYFDWLKGYFLYSFSSGIARNIDCFYYAPYNSKNIATIYSFSDTYFDRGLHPFIFRYVYEKISKDHKDVFDESFAAAASFATVILIGESNPRDIVWAILTWFCFSLEVFSRRYVKSFAYLAFGKHCLLFCFGLNYWFIILTKCIVICGTKTFITLVRRLFFFDVYDTIMTLCLGYCFARVVVETERMNTFNTFKSAAQKVLPALSPSTFQHLSLPMYQWMDHQKNHQKDKPIVGSESVK